MAMKKKTPSEAIEKEANNLSFDFYRTNPPLGAEMWSGNSIRMLLEMAELAKKVESAGCEAMSMMGRTDPKDIEGLMGVAALCGGESCDIFSMGTGDGARKRHTTSFVFVGKEFLDGWKTMWETAAAEKERDGIMDETIGSDKKRRGGRL